METYLLEWANLLLRWAHVVTAVAWIGASFYFVFLDSSLTPPQDEDLKRQGVSGELWAVHGGGFYHPVKFAVRPPELPKHLHWFYWESYSTWLTGFALFAISYLWNASSYLIDPTRMDWSPTAAVCAALGFLVVCWLAYDAICRLWGQRPERAIALAMPVILLGLALALDVFGAASGLGASGQWAQSGAGVAFAFGASAVFGLTLALTQHEVAAIDGRVRTVTTLALAGAVAAVVVMSQGGPRLPQDTTGWAGLVGLTVFYGTAFTILFTVLPRLGIVGNSALMSVEPVFALVLAWLLLDQAIAPLQLVGALIVVGAVVALGMRRKR